MPSIRKHDGLPNSDATKQATDTENNGQIMVPPRERNAFPSNINKKGYVIFSVSWCIIIYYAMVPKIYVCI